jgi:hypothetical protein
MTEAGKYESWTGHYRWNAETAAFTHPVHNHAGEQQTQEVVVKGDRMRMRTRKVFADGSTRSWTWDGALDGKPRPISWDDDGSTMALIGFFMLTDVMGGDVFEAGNGAFRGSEYFILGKDKYQIWGSTTDNGKQYTYFEEWERID